MGWRPWLFTLNPSADGFRTFADIKKPAGWRPDRSGRYLLPAPGDVILSGSEESLHYAKKLPRPFAALRVTGLERSEWQVGAFRRHHTTMSAPPATIQRLGGLTRCLLDPKA
jgi:hypothetical protein